MVEIICLLDILIFYILFYFFKKKIMAGQKIIAKFHDFQSQILPNFFDFWQFSIAPQHVIRYGKLLNPQIFAPFGLWKSWTKKVPKT